MPETIEADFLEGLVPQLEEQGYAVYPHPNRPLIPPFLKDYVPDIVALRNDKNLAIEIVSSKSSKSQDRLQQLTRLFEGQDQWEFRVYLVSPSEPQSALQIQTPEVIRQRIAELKEISGKGHQGPALLLGWATFEALSRALLSAEFKRPQSPGRLLEIMARDGYLTPSEADRVRSLVDKRNKLIHGDLQVTVSEDEVKSFAAILETLLGQLG